MDLPHRAPIHVVIMDSERMLLDSLAANLSSEPEISVVYADEDPQQGIRACLETYPEVAIIDVDLKGRDPFDVASEIHSRQKKDSHFVSGAICLRHHHRTGASS